MAGGPLLAPEKNATAFARTVTRPNNIFRRASARGSTPQGPMATLRKLERRARCVDNRTGCRADGVRLCRWTAAKRANYTRPTGRVVQG